jgi:hypothetical protein
MRQLALTLLVLLTGLATGCSRLEPSGKEAAKEGSTASVDDGNKSETDAGGGNSGGDDAPKQTYAIRQILTAGDAAARLEMSSASRLYLSEAGNLLHLSPSGLSSQFDAVNQAWGVTVQEQNGAGTLFLAGLQSAGWIGISPDQISYLQEEEALESFGLPVTVAAAADVVGFAPKAVAFNQSGTLHVFQFDGVNASLRKFTKSGPAAKSFGRCESGCEFWIWDGAAFLAVTAKGSALTAIDVPIVIPEGVEIQGFAGSLKLNGSAGEFAHLYALDAALTLYQGGQEVAAEWRPTWTNVLAIAQESCIPCHNDDGFDKESVWTGLKSEVIRRVEVATKTEVFAMPTWETNYGKEFSDARRQLIIAWLNGEDQTTGTDFGQGGGSTSTPLTGRLKELSDANCKSCHPKATNVEYWRARKVDAADRVDTGDMPRGAASIDASQRDELEALLRAL